MRRVLVGACLVSACFRDTAPAVPANRAPVVAPVACSPVDDLHAAPVDPSPGGRLRTHTSGPLSARGTRSWTGPAIPEHVPRKVGTLELFLLDAADGGSLAFYREPYGLGSCGLGGAKNCAYGARFYNRAGALIWKLKLDPLLSRPDHLEIQDIRLAGGVLYFNEACQSYSSGAGGACSSLVAVEPREGRVLWRSDPLVSNGRFRIRGCYIVAGYGFTSEPDYVYLVDRATGTVRQQLRVSSAPEQMTLAAADRLDVELYSGVQRHYRLDGFDGAGSAAKLVALDPDEYGGQAYGGQAYGGATYGGRPRRP